MPMKSEAVRNFVFAPIGFGRGGEEKDLVAAFIANANRLALNLTIRRMPVLKVVDPFCLYALRPT